LLLSWRYRMATLSSWCLTHGPMRSKKLKCEIILRRKWANKGRIRQLSIQIARVRISAIQVVRMCRIVRSVFWCFCEVPAVFRLENRDQRSKATLLVHSTLQNRRTWKSTNYIDWARLRSWSN
jgi:hypothetical protein